MFGVAAGVLLAESTARGVRWSQLYQAMQILSWTTPAFSYLASSGAILMLVINAEGLDIQAYLGSNMQLNFFKGNVPWNVGINFIALALLIWLKKIEKQDPPATEPAPG